MRTGASDVQGSLLLPSEFKASWDTCEMAMQKHKISTDVFQVKISFVVVVCFVFSRLGFSIAVEPVLELALVDQAGSELTEIRLPLLSKCWD